MSARYYGSALNRRIALAPYFTRISPGHETFGHSSPKLLASPQDLAGRAGVAAATAACVLRRIAMDSDEFSTSRVPMDRSIPWWRIATINVLFSVSLPTLITG